MTKHPEITEYRACVGVMLINKAGLVWVGRRFDKQNDEGVGHWWQMPQGGIDKGEDVRTAGLRELAEETAVTSAEIIAESQRWYNYDLPEHLIGKSWNHACGLAAFDVKIFGIKRANTMSELRPSRALVSADSVICLTSSIDIETREPRLAAGVTSSNKMGTPICICPSFIAVRRLSAVPTLR